MAGFVSEMAEEGAVRLREAGAGSLSPRIIRFVDVDGDDSTSMPTGDGGMVGSRTRIEEGEAESAGLAPRRERQAQRDQTMNQPVLGHLKPSPEHHAARVVEVGDRLVQTAGETEEATVARAHHPVAYRVLLVRAVTIEPVRNRQGGPLVRAGRHEGAQFPSSGRYPRLSPQRWHHVFSKSSKRPQRWHSKSRTQASRVQPRPSTKANNRRHAGKQQAGRPE